MEQLGAYGYGCRACLLNRVRLNGASVKHDSTAVFYRLAIHIHCTHRYSHKQRSNFSWLSSLSAGTRDNNGECPVDVILFSWEHDKLPSQEEVMDIFHFNTNLQLRVSYERSQKNFAEENELERVFKCRRQLPSESSFFETLPKVLDGYV